MSNDSSIPNDTVIDINLNAEPVITDEKLISNLECIIKHLKDGNTYTYEDKELLMYRTEEYVTGERKKLDPEILNYLFAGWFVSTQRDWAKK